MKEHVYRFRVILADLEEVSEDAAEALYEAGCDDGLCGSSEGIADVMFDREAKSLDEAVRTAVRDVRKAGFQVARIEIDRDDLEHLIQVPATANS
ncbi:MAG: hypothetical protein ACREJB_06965 [Planctomycetaceae bacterium]